MCTGLDGGLLGRGWRGERESGGRGIGGFEWAWGFLSRARRKITYASVDASATAQGLFMGAVWSKHRLISVVKRVVQEQWRLQKPIRRKLALARDSGSRSLLGYRPSPVFPRINATHGLCVSILFSKTGNGQV